MSGMVPVVRFTVKGQPVETSAPRWGGEGRAYTLVYDGDCKVCTRLARVLATWDVHGLIEVVPFQNPSVAPRFPWIPERAYREAMQLVQTSTGKTWQGAAAAEELLNILPKGCLIGWLFNVPLIRPLADRVYKAFARNRYRLGCGEHCTYKPGSLDYRDSDS
jgi:predicted DCC family thiol-disulfide oxidoreductase YuxK